MVWRYHGEYSYLSTKFGFASLDGSEKTRFTGGRATACRANGVLSSSTLGMIKLS